MKTLAPLLALLLATLTVPTAVVAQETAPPDNSTVTPVDRRGLPAEVPNIYDPEVRVNLRVTGAGTLFGNQDFPLIALLTATGETLVLGLDARNGKDTWSFREDQVILIVHGPAVFVDAGFLAAGRSSGSYSRVETGDLPGVLNRLEGWTKPPPTQHL